MFCFYALSFHLLFGVLSMLYLVATSLAKIFCSLWMRSASAWPVGLSSKSPWIYVLIRAFQSSTCRLKKTVSIRWEKSGWVVRAVFACLGKSRWGAGSISGQIFIGT